MAKRRLTSYTFDASAQTVTHPDFSEVGLDGIQLIVNVTDQIIIYNFADQTKGGTLATDTLTLEYNTTSMSDTDDLMILVEDGLQQTITAELSATDNAVLDSIDTSAQGVLADTANIDTNIGTIAGAVSGTEMQVDIVDGSVGINGSFIDSFGHLVTASVNNQVDIQYYRDTPANLVTVTTASGGTATATGGMATYAATTTANSSAKGVTNETTYYTGGAEVYTIFTAGFTGSGSGTSYQRIGLYNDNDGFFLGYEAGSFGVTVRKGGSDTTVASGSFSDDTLTGGAGSLFTRNGTPEAVDFTKLNVWRIRYGWVGSAPITFEVLAPDGDWVVFHKIKQPNNATLPSIENSDLPVTCHVNSGNSGQALTIITNCWVAGTTQSLTQMDSTIVDKTYAQLTRSVITGETTAGGGGYVNVKVNPSGSLAVAADTELPDAAALADNTANPTVPGVGAFGMMYDGSTWDRVRGTSTDGLLVNLGTNNDVSASQSGTWNITNISGTVSLPTGAATAANQTTANGLLTDIETNTDFGAVTGGGTETGALRVTLANNSTGVLSVDDNDGSLTVDGTVAATQSGTWNIADITGTVSLPTGAATAANQTTIIGHVDGIEGLLTTIDADTSTLAAVDFATSAKQDTIIGHVDGIETLIGTTNTTLGTIDTDTGNIATYTTSLQYLHTEDYDTGAGTDTTTAVGLVIPGNGGAVSVSSTNPLPTNLYVNGNTIDTNAGNSTANTIRTVIASDQVAIPITDNAGSITVDGTVAATQSGTWNITNISGTVSLPTGASTAANQTTIIGHVDGIETLLGTIDADTSALAGAVSGTEVQVDVVASLPAGTNNIGKFVLTDGTDDATVRDVTGAKALDVSIVDGSGNQITSFGGGTQYTEGDIDASITGTAMMMEVAADTLQPVQGTVADGLLVNLGSNNDVTASQSGTWNITNISGTVSLPTGAATAANQTTIIGHVDGIEGLLTTIDADTSALAGAVSGAEVQVDVVASLPAGTNAIGKLAANSGVDIGDVDVTSIIPGTGATNLGKAEDAAHTSGDTGVMALAVRTDTPDTAKSGTNGDYTPVAVTSTGAVRTAPMSEDFAALANGPQVKKYYTSSGAATDGIIWSPAAGKRWYVTDIFINVSAATTVTLEDDLAAGDATVWKAELAANSGWSHRFETPLFSGEDAADLLITTGGGNVYVTVTGYEI